jgi:hypothetical protein
MASDDKVASVRRRETTDNPVYTGRIDVIDDLTVITAPVSSLPSDDVWVLDSQQLGGMADQAPPSRSRTPEGGDVSDKAKRYRVTAACVVHIPIATQAGPTLGTLYRHSVFTAAPDSTKIQHLLDSGMIEEIGDDGQPVASDPASGTPASAAASTEPGSQAPQVTARSTKAELVEYAVAQGMGRGEADKLTVKELVERYVRQQ